MRKIAIALSALLFLPGCGNLAEPSNTDRAVKIYFVSDTPRGFKLFSEIRNFTDSKNFSQEVISQLISGDLTPLDPDYVNLWGASSQLRSIK